MNEIEEALGKVLSELDDEVVDSIRVEIEGDGSLVEKKPRGIFSHADREYLIGQRTYKHAQSESNRKQEIRERIRYSFQDFVLLYLFLDQSEREKLFDELNEDDLRNQIISLIAFVYLGIEKNETWIENVVEEGVYTGAREGDQDRWSGEVTDVQASINIRTNPDADDLYREWERGDLDSLTPREIGCLVQAGKLTSDDLEVLKHQGRHHYTIDVMDLIKSDS